MVDKICEFLTNKIRKEMPEIDDQRAEIINYGLQNIIGEIPKIILIISRFSINNTDTIIPHIGPYICSSFNPFIVAKIRSNCAIPINIDNVFSAPPNNFKQNAIIAKTSIPIANPLAFFIAFSYKSN